MERHFSTRLLRTRRLRSRAMNDTTAIMDPRDLYGLPLEEFTAERNALAKQLRRDGQRERADEVSKLRKTLPWRGPAYALRPECRGHNATHCWRLRGRWRAPAIRSPVPRSR